MIAIQPAKQSLIACCTLPRQGPARLLIDLKGRDDDDEYDETAPPTLAWEGHNGGGKGLRRKRSATVATESVERGTGTRESGNGYLTSHVK